MQVSKMIAFVALAINTVSAQMTMSGMGMNAMSGMTLSGQGQGSALGQYAGAYPSYSSQQTFGQQPMAQFNQGSTQVNAQVGQFKVPSSQTLSVPAGQQYSQYSAPTQQYSQYSAPTQQYSQYSAPTQQYSQYSAPTQQYSTQQYTAPTAQYQYSSQPTSGMGYSTQSAMGLPQSAMGVSQSGMTLPQGYAQAGQYSTQYPGQQSYSGMGMTSSGMGMSSSGMGMTSGMGASSGMGAPGSTQTVQNGVRTMYVPLNQVQQVLGQYPGAKMVGTVTADQIPAGSAVY